MTTAEATGEREEARPEHEPDADAGAQQKSASGRERVPPSSPPLSSSWLLRAAAFVAVAAAAMGVIIAPGTHGNTSEQVVVRADWVSACLGYFLFWLVVPLAMWGGVELVRARGVSWAARTALIGGGVVVVVLSMAGLKVRLEAGNAVALSAGAAVAAIAAAYSAARAPHTRAIAGILFAFAFAAIARIGAWELATAAGDVASMRLFRWGQIAATAAVLFEASGQLFAVIWIWTRSRFSGQLGAAAALVATVAIMLGVRSGMHSGAALWQSVLHTALADAAGVPSPLWFDALAVFLVPASLLLALVAAAQPKQVVTVVATVALALVSRGSFDAPLRALCAVVAAHWATLACVDERAMWRTLLEERKRKLEDA
jgi:hypothetical protein